MSNTSTSISSKYSMYFLFRLFETLLSDLTYQTKTNKNGTFIIEILKEYKIKSYSDRKNVGIWVGNPKNLMKIAAIGIRVKKWIAYHGFSLNISTDLSSYKRIVPCGIKNKGITSLKKLGANNYNNINQVIIKNFLNTFL